MDLVLRNCWLGAILSAGLLQGQGSLVLKTRTIRTPAKSDAAQGAAQMVTPPIGTTHFLIQFGGATASQDITALSRRGVRVLGDVPTNGVLATIREPVDLSNLNITYASPLQPVDKISPLITAGDPSAANGFLLVEVFPDVRLVAARSAFLNLGITLQDNPDLGPTHLMVVAPAPQALAIATALSKLDDVAYVFPAAPEVASGQSGGTCLGALTWNGAISQLIPTYGSGWDGAGLGVATLGFVYSHLTSQVAQAATEQAIAAAMAEWSKAVQVTWVQGTNATASRTVNIVLSLI